MFKTKASILKRSLLAAAACTAMAGWAYAVSTSGDLQLAAAPALLAGAQVRTLKAKKSDEVKAARAITDKASAESRDLTEDEQAKFDAHLASAKGIDAQIERHEQLAQAEAGLSKDGFVIRDGARIEVMEDETDPTGGFKSMGHFAQTVMQASQPGGNRDERLRIGAAAPGSTTANESSGPDGGFEIPPEFSKNIWRLSLGEQSLIPLTENSEVNGNSMIFPKDETTPWGGSGVQAYWQIEAAQAAASKPQLTSQAMVLHKLIALVPVTSEQLADGSQLASYLPPQAGEKIMWKANEAILFGDGIGKPKGALTKAGAAGSPAIVIAKESGQAANTVDPKNITKMVERLLVGELGRAFWLATPDILTPLEAMTIGQFPIYLPGMTSANAPYGMLKGRPLQLSEHAAALSSQGDLSLISLKGYRTLTKAGGIETATSMHLYFDADAMAFRFTFRINGAPIMSGPVTPPKSSNTRSHFVTLGAR